MPRHPARRACSPSSALAQDERRAVFEWQSHHIAIGMRYLPAVARRLHHCRDLGPAEPFDFLTGFDYAPEYEPAFDELLGALGNSPERAMWTVRSTYGWCANRLERHAPRSGMRGDVHP